MPAAQGVHDSQSPYSPGLHTQSRSLPDPTLLELLARQERHCEELSEANRGENVFAGHGSHIYMVSFSLYRPGAHAVQLPPGTPSYPRLQVQFTCETEPSALAAFDVQPTHCVTFALLESGLYVLTGHAVHELRPALSPYVPGVHA